MAGIETREFWSPFVPGTGIVATMNTEKHCYITNQNVMLDQLHSTFTRQPNYASLADRPDFQSLVYGPLPSANLLVWINPREAGATLRKQAAYFAETEVEFSIDWTTQRRQKEAEALQELFTGRSMTQLYEAGKKRVSNLVDARLQSYRDEYKAEQVPLVMATKERQIAYLESISSVLMMLRLEPKQFKLSLRVQVPLSKSP